VIRELGTVPTMAESGIDVEALVTEVLQCPGPVRLVAIDGPGGAGKTTFAERFAAAADGAPIVHTDDFASADNPIDWWPRLLAEVIEPLSFVIWIETPSVLRLQRGLDRDGPSAADQWESWMAAEDAYFARDPVRERAHVVVDGSG